MCSTEKCFCKLPSFIVVFFNTFGANVIRSAVLVEGWAFSCLYIIIMRVNVLFITRIQIYLAHIILIKVWGWLQCDLSYCQRATMLHKMSSLCRLLYLCPNICHNQEIVFFCCYCKLFTSVEVEGDTTALEL